MNSFFKHIIYISLAFFMGLNCSSNSTPQQSTSMAKLTKQKDPISDNGRSIISAPIVEKRFMKKNGEASDQTELYAQRSIQDYFIKFCESEVSREEMEAHLEGLTGLIKAVKMEVEFRKGEWDRCGEEEVQSRTGEYIVVYKIF